MVWEQREFLHIPSNTLCALEVHFSIKNFCNLIFSSWLVQLTLVWGQNFIHKQWSINFEWLGSLKTFFWSFLFQAENSLWQIDLENFGGKMVRVANNFCQRITTVPIPHLFPICVCFDTKLFTRVGQQIAEALWCNLLKYLSKLCRNTN